MTAIVLRGDARQLPLPDGCVDLIVTSPPYFGLRSYTDGGEHYDGQIGSESTVGEYLETLWTCTAEWMRVLRPGGSIFVNIGDKYSDRGHGPNRGNGTGRGPQNTHLTQTRGPMEKSLLGLPWRYAIGCTDHLGLILRAEIVWSKPNGLPESVTDRVRRSHEQVFHLVKQPRYYAAVDEIREPYSENKPWGSSARAGQKNGSATAFLRGTSLDQQQAGLSAHVENPLGKLPGSVWSIPSAPLQVPAHLGIDHFAAFPPALVRPLVLGWSPPGVCTGCGQGRRPVRETDWSQTPHWMAERRSLTDEERAEAATCFREWQDGQGIPSKVIAAMFPSRTGGLTGCVANWRQGFNLLTPEQLELLQDRFGAMPERLREIVHWKTNPSLGVTELVPTGGNYGHDADSASGIYVRHRTNSRMAGTKSPPRTITGYACACPSPDAPTRPALVVDPFAGTGTTMLVASAYGRLGVGVDRSMDYARLARWRCHDPGERARARDMPKPPPVPEGMEPLFTM